MRNIALACGILAGVVSVSIGAMSDDEWQRADHNCFENKDKSACQALINNGLPSVQQCYIEKGKGNCSFVAILYFLAERYREAIPYYEKAISLGYTTGYGMLGAVYGKLQDWYNAKKYLEIGCKQNKGELKAESCYELGVMHLKGVGVDTDERKALNYLGEACDLGLQPACELHKNITDFYVKQAESILEHAKAYFGEDEFRKAMMEREIEQKRLDLELKRLELERQKLEQKLQKYR